MCVMVFREKFDCENNTHTNTHEKTSMNNLMPTVFPFSQLHFITLKGIIVIISKVISYLHKMKI